MIGPGASPTDAELLSRFARDRSEEAFRILVERYAPLVHATCRRGLGPDASAAEEASQAVFLVLARSAGRLRNPAALGTWLFRTCTFVVRRIRRDSERRRRRQAELAARLKKEQAMETEPAEAAWERALPHLNDALAALRGPQQQAIVMHYLQGRPHREVALALGCTEGAVKKRVAWALEKMRSFLAGRGIWIPAALLAAGLQSEAASAAPPGLAAACTAAGLGGASAGAAQIAEGTLKVMFWAKFKTFAAAALAAVAAVGGILSVPPPEGMPSRIPFLASSAPEDPLPPFRSANLGIDPEEAPAFPEPAPADLPEGARWPTLRSAQPLRLGFICTRSGKESGQLIRIARRLGAVWELRLIPSGTDWNDLAQIHENLPYGGTSKGFDSTLPEVQEHGRRVWKEGLVSPEGKPAYDVLFCGTYEPDLLPYVEAGGLWVCCSRQWPTPPFDEKLKNTPLASAWPARGGGNTWHAAGSVHEFGAPELAGVPTRKLSDWIWTERAEAAPGAVQVARGESGAGAYRRIGRGILYFQPSGPIPRFHDAIRRHHRLYDHDEIALRFWDQLLHWLARGELAFPAWIDVRPDDAEAAPGSLRTLACSVTNRAVTSGKFVLGIHVVSPVDGRVVHRAEKPLEVRTGETIRLDVPIAVGRPWGGRLWPVYLTLGDPARKLQIHQALDFIPVAKSLDLRLAADKTGCRTGDRITFSLSAGSPEPWSGTIRFGIYDFRGRELGGGRREVLLGPMPKTMTFDWAWRDHGARVRMVWAVASAVKDGQEWGRTEIRLARRDPAAMREESCWATWANIANGPPSLIPQALRMMGFAGLNANIGMGTPEPNYTSERWGMRHYFEGVGTNTWSPPFECENDREIQEWIRKSRRQEDPPGLTSPACALASFGEEAGFVRGWGARYVWDTPTAPPKAARAFQWYLRGRYPDLATLNAAWRTSFKRWEDIPLAREFSEANPQSPDDGWVVPRSLPADLGLQKVSVAPYRDTAAFYHWYYKKYCAAAKKILNEEINPVPRTFVSAPSSDTFVPDELVEVGNNVGGGWHDLQVASLQESREPTIAGCWGFMTNPIWTDEILWGHTMNRSTFRWYWVDVPLTFNHDWTLPSSTMEIRRWRHRYGTSLETLVLDSRLREAQAGVLKETGSPPTRGPGWDVATTLKVALQQVGVPWESCEPGPGLAKYRCVFAPGSANLSPREAAALDAYVRGGGTLVFWPGFARYNEYGVPCPSAPGQGLDAKWGISFTRLESGRDRHPRADLSRLGADWKGLELAPGRLGTRETGAYEQVSAPSWKVLASYEDKEKTPAVLERSLGRGKLVLINSNYHAHWYIQFEESTDERRQGFVRLVERFVLEAGARPVYRLEGNPRELLTLAPVHWTDRTGRISTVILFVRGTLGTWARGGTWVPGTFSWKGPEKACYDLTAGDPERPAPLVGGTEIPLNLRSSMGRALAFIAAPVKEVRVRPLPPALGAGEPLKVAVDVLDPSGRPIPGRFPIELRVRCGDREIRAMERRIPLASGETVSLETSPSDPPGSWTLIAREGISRLQGSASVTVSSTVPSGPGFQPWGWPSERWEPARLFPEDFVDRLRRLAALYRAPFRNDWTDQQTYGSYDCFFPGTRHHILRPLADVSWTDYVPALRKAIEEGAEIILTGEDVDIDPQTGLGVHPLHDGRRLEAVIQALKGASWRLATADGETVEARLGRGRALLWRDSIDAAYPDGTSVRGYLTTWREDLEEGRDLPALPAPDLKTLSRWWAGLCPITDRPRVVKYWDSHLRSETFTIQPGRSRVLHLALPPQGEVQELSVDLGGDAVRIDVGGDGREEGLFTTPIDWKKEISGYLSWRQKTHGDVERDRNRWRLVPIRLTPTDGSRKATGTAGPLKLVVR